jgi:tryptophan 2,3-dioxygenase
MAFELDAVAGRTTLLPGLRPPPTLVGKRCHLALRAALPALRRSGLIGDDHAVEPADLPGMAALIADEAEHRMLTTTMLPVYTLHDEYLFIRVLQSYESAFALMAMYLRAAIFATATNRLADAITYIETAGQVLIDSRALFSLLGTLQPQAFHEFRNFTEGASAIQSRNYKIVESLCREPDPDRLRSTAYESVPEVKTLIHDGQLSLEQALRTARRRRPVDAGPERALVESMADLSNQLQRWRKTHYSLAVRVLGTKTGTGYTVGTPYLAEVRTIPIFTVPADGGP